MQIQSKSNASAVLKDWKRLRKDYRKAVASGLNKAAYRVANEDMPRVMEKGIDRPVPFTKRKPAFYRKANVNNLKAYVQVKDIQAKYLGNIVFGGKTKKGTAVPVKIRLNKYGNIASLKDGKKVRALLAKPGHFIQRMGGTLGLWRRTGKRVELLIYFSQGSYRYRRQFKWHKLTRQAAARQLPGAMNEAINKAIKREAVRTAGKVL